MACLGVLLDVYGVMVVGWKFRRWTWISICFDFTGYWLLLSYYYYCTSV